MSINLLFSRYSSLVKDFNVVWDVRVGELPVPHVLQRLWETTRDHLGVEAAHLIIVTADHRTRSKSPFVIETNSAADVIYHSNIKDRGHSAGEKYAVPKSSH